MIEGNLQFETEIRRFLLGEMPEDERTLFEENFIADEDLFEQIRVVEDELIESYVRGTLTAAEAKSFERSFLSTEPRRRRVAFARTMLDKFAGQTAVAVEIKKAENDLPVWDSIANFFKVPKLAIGAAFAVLVLIFGGWLALRNSTQPEIVQHTTPTPTIVQTVQPNQNQSLSDHQNASVNSNTNIAEENSANKNVSPNANRELPNKNQNSNPPKQDSIGVAPILALSAGMVRADGKMREVSLSKSTERIYLQLNLDSHDYKVYRVEIADPDGNLILQNNNLKAKNSKINLSIPAAKLPRGEYMVKLSALNPQNENESVADYTFRVNRK